MNESIADGAQTTFLHSINEQVTELQKLYDRLMELIECGVHSPELIDQFITECSIAIELKNAYIEICKIERKDDIKAELTNIKNEYFRQAYSMSIDPDHLQQHYGSFKGKMEVVKKLQFYC